MWLCTCAPLGRRLVGGMPSTGDSRAQVDEREPQQPGSSLHTLPPAHVTAAPSHISGLGRHLVPAAGTGATCKVPWQRVWTCSCRPGKVLGTGGTAAALQPLPLLPQHERAEQVMSRLPSGLPWLQVWEKEEEEERERAKMARARSWCGAARDSGIVCGVNSLPVWVLRGGAGSEAH